MEKFKNLNVYTNIRRPDGNCKTKAEVLYDLVLSYIPNKLSHHTAYIRGARDLYDSLIESGIVVEDVFLDEDKDGYL